MGSSGDDDLVGFVFGYQDPHHFYLFDWKRGTQTASGCGTASQGMSLKRVAFDTPYDFRLVHTATTYLIEIRDGATVIATLSGSDSRYPVGRFGFYNYSQDNVLYEFFQAKDP